MASVSINEISIQTKAITAAKKRQFVGLARSAANTRFIFAKNDLLEEIEQHPVSQELKQGNENQTNSNLIEDGSLRAFIGFYPEDNPVKDLKDYFNNNTKMNPEPKISDNGKDKIFFNFKVSIPSKNQIYSEKIFELPDRWQNRSYLEVIEQGVSNAIHFVMAKLAKTAERFTKGGSRSGWGLQKENVDTGRSFSPTPYISEIINNFLDKFK